jgi:quercetin dioxygenase-like cupin family protein
MLAELSTGYAWLDGGNDEGKRDPFPAEEESLMVTPAAVRDPVVVTPKVVKVRLENDRVRVLEFKSDPGDKEDWHFHPPFVTYVLNGGTLRITTPDGQSSDIEFKTGDILDRPPGAHATENVGTTQLHALLFELKTP